MSLSLVSADPGSATEFQRPGLSGIAQGEGAQGVFGQKAAKKNGKKGFFSTILSRLRAASAQEGAKDGAGKRVQDAKMDLDGRSLVELRPDPVAAKLKAGKNDNGNGQNEARGGLKDAADARARKSPVRRELPSASYDAGLERFQMRPIAARAKPGKSEESGGEAKAEDARGPRKTSRSERLKIDVYDLRSRKEAEAEAAKTVETKNAATQDAGRIEGSKDIVVDLFDREAPADHWAAKASEGQGPAGSFSARLAERLGDVYNAEIVKQGSMVLRNGDAGTIRLLLHPESLGNVKVRLELADNSITGSIIVESEEAREAFEADIERLAKDFIDSGFQDAKLEVSVDSGNGGRAATDGGAAFLTPRGASAATFDSAETGRAAFGATGFPGAVDILA